MKTNHLLLYLILCLAAFACKKDPIKTEEPPISTFEKNIGGSADDIANSIVIKDDALYVLGQTKSINDVNGDHYLLKLDLNGNIIFEKTYGGNLAEEGIRIITTKDGNFILTGTTESAGNGQKDIHVLKVNQEGTILWEKTFGGALDDKPADVIETSQAEFCIAGTTESFGAGSRDIYLTWIDQSGNLIRQATFGGSDIDGSSGLLEIENEDIMLYGYTRNFGATSRDLYLMKLTSTGDSLWSKRYGGDGYEESQDFAQTQTGGFLLGGHSSSTDLKHDMYAVKVDANGNQIWEKNYGGLYHDGGQSLLINEEGNYAFLGRTRSFGSKNQNRNIFIVRTDPMGKILSQIGSGRLGDDWGQDIIEYGSFYFIAGHSNSFGDGDNDVYLMKTNK